MSSPTIWTAGRYQAVAQHIAPIAAEVVAAVDRRRPVRGAAVADLACGTGNAARAACARGARVTAVDITPELPGNPFFRPVAAVLGPPAPSAYSPDQWGDAATIIDRLAADFDDVEIETDTHTWQLGTIDEAVHFVTRESPMHVSVLGNVDGAERDQLLAAFEDTMREHVDAHNAVSYDAPYLVVTAQRR